MNRLAPSWIFESFEFVTYTCMFSISPLLNIVRWKLKIFSYQDNSLNGEKKCEINSLYFLVELA